MATNSPQSSLFEWVRQRTTGPRGVLDASTAPGIDLDLGRLLHRALEEHMGTVDLILTDNRRRMVSIRKRHTRHEIRLHHMFLGCDTTVVNAIAGLAKNNDNARQVIREFIRDNRESIRAEQNDTEVVEAGQHHDLRLYLQRAQTLLPEAPEVRITWGRDGKGRRSIRFGSFDFEQKLIRMHPALDAAWVPDYFVEFVVFHELLHSIFPPSANAARRALHPAEFREREKEFPRYEEALSWENKNIRKFLSR
jgi:hypothetical protein